MSANDEILVVDDEVAIVAFIAELLVEEGYPIRTAYDGAQALETITTQLPALVLLDYSMPHMTGADVLLRVRQSGSTLPVIVMSAEWQAERVLTQGANAFLHKPFELNTLLDCIAEHYAPLREAMHVGAEPNIALYPHTSRATATRQLLRTSRGLRWDARWLSANSQRLQQRSQRLQQASERLRRQSAQLFNWP
jgi:CheY-like chemotaxis protein